MPALGFYEWQAITDAAGRPGKQPWHIRVGDQPVFGMAGLWDASTRADGSVVESCAVIPFDSSCTTSGDFDDDHR